MDHRDGGVNRHHIGFAFHAGDGRELLAQGLRAFDLRVVLAGLPSDTGASERVRAEDIATAASPKEIMSDGVLLVAVNVAHLDVAGCAAKGAYWFARRSAFPGVRPVA